MSTPSPVCGLPLTTALPLSPPQVAATLPGLCPRVNTHPHKFTHKGVFRVTFVLHVFHLSLAKSFRPKLS